jgi:DNA-binding MarR family transcriptional regulator
MDYTAFSKARRCACGNIRRATRSLTQFYDGCLKPSGIRATQFSMLLNIALNEGITISELADLLAMDQTTVTRNLSALKRDRFIEFYSGDKDARKKRLRLTAVGEAKLAEAMPLWDVAQKRIENALGPDRFHEMLQIFSHLVTVTK